MRYLGLVLLASACGRVGFEAIDDRFVPTHLPGAPPQATASLVLRAAAIDTTMLTIDGAAAPAGASFAAASQMSGVDLALLAVDHLEVPADSTVRVIGSRPLVIVATSISIDGVIDAGAHGVIPGPGGGAPGEGTGAGASTEKPIADVCDPGAGGGGFAQAGADGGAEACATTYGIGGAIYGDPALAIFVGGSGGGMASGGTCADAAGGAGGGAIQLTALGSLSITGGITAGGGGGAGGIACGSDDAGAGAGGGAGGAIFVEARDVDVRGTLAAHGGGGGAGGNGQIMNGPVGTGESGSDATLAQPGAGGVALAGTSGNGGAGGSDTASPVDGSDAEFNPGGGGGGAGRIVVNVVE